jgi:hypothetical protein
VIIAVLETCCREGEPLSLRWVDVSLARGELVLRAEHTKDREKRLIPISSRLRQVREMRRTDPDGRHPPSAHVFGDQIGRRVGSVRRAWQTAVLRAHGHKPVWIWTKKKKKKKKSRCGLSSSLGNLASPLQASPPRGPRPARRQAPASDGNSLIH